MRTEPASLLQSGKALRFGVRQTRTCPFSLRSPVTLTSTVGGGGAAAVSNIGKSAKPDIRAARLVPKAEIETIIPPISRMMRLMMRRGYQPSPCRSMNKRARKHLPPHMIADPHHRHDREHAAEQRDMAREDEDEPRKNDGPGDRLHRGEAHRPPSGRR